MSGFRSRSIILLLVLGGLPLAGCSQSSTGPLPAKENEKARALLESVLESWKKGQTPDSLAPVKVVDSDWSGGGKLTDYEILADGKVKDGTVTIPVKITTNAPGMKPGGKQV